HRGPVPVAQQFAEGRQIEAVEPQVALEPARGADTGAQQRLVAGRGGDRLGHLVRSRHRSSPPRSPPPLAPDGGRVVIIRTAEGGRNAVTDTVIVRFEGAGSGVAELSWGQHEIWQVMADKGDSLPIGGVRALPPGQTVADVAAGLRFVMGRHQSLRTRLRLVSGGLPEQVVHDRGEIALEVADGGDGAPSEAAPAVVAGYMTRSFDYERDWPVRMAVITRHGAATH